MITSIVPFALAVDDEPMILIGISDILEDAGYSVHASDDGDAAKVLLSEHAESITLLFSDVNMPGETDGFALARHVNELYPWIEIVIASGQRAPRPGEMPSKTTFLSKPYSARIVHDHLRLTLPDGKKPDALKRAM